MNNAARDGDVAHFNPHLLRRLRKLFECWLIRILTVWPVADNGFNSLALQNGQIRFGDLGGHKELA